MREGIRVGGIVQSGALRVVREAQGLASGALAGVAFGSAAGPHGAITGAILGGIAGTLAGAALDNAAARQAEHDEELDRVIGVIGGELGAPNLDHPPAGRAAWYSQQSMGALPDEPPAPSEGPMPPADAE
jgi:hypothetical protein